MVRMFAKVPGDRCSIPGWVIPKTQKLVLDASLLNSFRTWIKSKWSNPGKGVAPSPTPRCGSYCKVSLWTTLDYCWPTYIYDNVQGMLENLLTKILSMIWQFWCLKEIYFQNGINMNSLIWNSFTNLLNLYTQLTITEIIIETIIVWSMKKISVCFLLECIYVKSIENNEICAKKILCLI